MSDFSAQKYSDSPAEKALFGLAVYRRNRDGNWVLRPRVGALALVFVFLIIAIYFSAATGMYILNRYYRNCEETSYKDMMLYVIPNRLPFTNVTILPDFLNDRIVLARLSQRAKLGDVILKNAKGAQDILLAANLNPRNLDAQLIVAKSIFLNRNINRIDHAFELLDKTVEYALRDTSTVTVRQENGTERQVLFINEYTKLCFGYNQDYRIIATAEKYLESPEIGPAVKTSLSLSYAEAFFLRGDFEKSIKILEKYQLLKTLSGYLLHAQIIWENGEHERAYALLNAANRNKTDQEVNVRLLYTLAKFYYEEKRYEDAALALSQIVIQYKPNDFQARIAMLPLLNEEKHRPRKQEIIETLLKQFASNESAMLMLGSYAADQGDVELQRRINKIAMDPSSHFLRLANFRLLVVETQLTAGKNSGALNEIATLFTQDPEWLKSSLVQPQFESLRMLAYFADKQNDLGKITFNKIADNNEIPVVMQVLIARRLLKLDRYEEAKMLLTNAYIRNNRNFDVLLELVKIDLAGDGTTTLSEHLGYLIDSRRPPRYVIENAYKKLSSDRFIFTPKRSQLLNALAEMLRVRNLPQNEIERKSYLPY